MRQSNLAYGELIGVGVVMVQQFLTAPSLDLSAKTCVITFAVAIPLLAALVVNRQEAFHRRVTKSIVVSIANAVAYFDTGRGPNGGSKSPEGDLAATPPPPAVWCCS